MAWIFGAKLIDGLYEGLEFFSSRSFLLPKIFVRSVLIIYSSPSVNRMVIAANGEGRITHILNFVGKRS